MARDNGNSSIPILSMTDGIAAAWQDFLILVARVMLGWIFLYYGAPKLQNIPAYAKTFPARDLPEWLAYVAVPVEVLGGIFLIVGFATRYTAIVMFLFMVVATLSSHRWWNYPAAQQGGQQANFWKNVGMTGGIILLFVTAGGRYALDAMLKRR